MTIFKNVFYYQLLNIKFMNYYFSHMLLSNKKLQFSRFEILTLLNLLLYLKIMNCIMKIVYFFKVFTFIRSFIHSFY